MGEVAMRRGLQYGSRVRYEGRGAGPDRNTRSVRRLGLRVVHDGGRVGRRSTMRCICWVGVWGFWACTVAFAAQGGEGSGPIWRVFPEGQRPQDARLGPPRTLRDAYHPWQPPETLAQWKQTAQALRERLRVSMGLWPLPEKRPLRPVVHGRIDRGEYTIEKVFFASRPGVYVTGNLYRPKKISGKVPGVLCPHGHWSRGRFYEANDKTVKDQIEKGAEQFECGARYPLQARMVQLARMGCVVFHYDMIGYADNQPLSHRDGFRDVEAALRLHNVLGLQTFNSMRALDFLLSLPEVDPHRIGVTGASGGGTQTFMLCALDPRPAVAFPAVMVSTAMQGGCVCENADYLRIGINNIAIAALFAPKPMAMSGADDWTIDIETKGLPELKQIYGLFGRADQVAARCFPQFKHNYNQVSRTMMYEWFNRYLQLGQKTPIRERPFEPVPPKQLSVFDETHPLPQDALTAAELRQRLRQADARWFRSLLPKQKTGVERYRETVGVAARVMLDPQTPRPGQVTVTSVATRPLGDGQLEKGTLSRAGGGEQIPWVLLQPKNFRGRVVAWFDAAGKSALFEPNKAKPIGPVQRLLAVGVAVASADVFGTGEFLSDPNCPARPRLVDPRYSGYTFGYNRPWLSRRVRDVLAVLAWLAGRKEVQQIDLVGTGPAGVWTLLARPFAGDPVGQTVADLHGFGFSRIHDQDDPMFLPGALKYGGIGGLAALAVPAKLTLVGTRGVPVSELQPLQLVYAAAGASGALTLRSEPLVPAEVVNHLLP
ncbi:MAG TPA: hypothetical protein EYP14_03430 [Planctomycetaceae bacterium]|nr:hypothetical protein [Planctomycetaceae bacterium]